MGRQNPAATQPATAVDPKTAQIAYWLDKPTIAHVSWRDFDRLWNASRDSMQDDGFAIDRRDYREGVLTSLPLVSKAAYEIWRNDVQTAHDLDQSTVGTVRRTIRFDIRRLADGSFQASPRVLVERYCMIERRVTSVSQYQDIFSIRLLDVNRENEEAGMAIPAEYWYPIARDYTLEHQLAKSVERHLSK